MEAIDSWVDNRAVMGGGIYRIGILARDTVAVPAHRELNKSVLLKLGQLG